MFDLAIDLEPFMHRILSILFSSILSNYLKLYQTNAKAKINSCNKVEVQKKATKALWFICDKFNSKSYNTKARCLQTLIKPIKTNTSTIESIYGSIIGIEKIGDKTAIRQTLLSEPLYRLLKRKIKETEICGSKTVGYQTLLSCLS